MSKENLIKFDPNSESFEIGYKDQTETVRPIQPIIFINPNNENKPQFHTQLPHSLPLQAFAFLNNDLLHCEEFLSLPCGTLATLAENNRNIAYFQTSEYIKRNTFINFCAMVDNCSEEMQPIIKYLPLKEVFQEYLSQDNYLTNIIASFFEDRSSIEGGFIPEDLSDSSTEYVKIFMMGIIKQIDVQIYSLINYAIDTAVNQVFLNVYNSPNYTQIINAARNICNYNDKKISKLYGEGNIGLILSNIIKMSFRDPVEKLMDCVINPSIKEIICGLPITSYGIFDGMRKIQIMDAQKINNSDDTITEV